MKLSPEIVTKFMSGLVLLLAGLGLFAIDDVETLTNAVNTVVTGVFTILGAFGIIRTVFKAKRHRELDDEIIIKFDGDDGDI